MSFKHELVKIKYGSKKDKLDYFENDIEVLNTNDNELINFVNLYRALGNFRIMYAGLNIVLCNDEFWTSINYARTAINKYFMEGNKNEYKKVENFILHNFKEALDKQHSEQKDKSKFFEKKLAKSQMLKLWHERHKEIEEIPTHPFTNIKHNDLIFLVQIWFIDDYYIQVYKELVREKRKHFWTLVVSIVFSFLIGIFTVFFAKWLQSFGG